MARKDTLKLNILIALESEKNKVYPRKTRQERLGDLAREADAKYDARAHWRTPDGKLY